MGNVGLRNCETEGLGALAYEIVTPDSIYQRLSACILSRNVFRRLSAGGLAPLNELLFGIIGHMGGALQHINPPRE